VLGQSTEGTITPRPVLDAGRLRIEVAETNLGTIQLPAIDQLLEVQISDRIRSLLDGLPVTVTSVGIDPARGLILTCQVDLERLDEASTPSASASR
jgi:hypothetical protein